MIGFEIACVLVEHVGSSGFHLCVEDCKPELSSGDLLDGFSLSFVFCVEQFEIFADSVCESWTGGWAEE